MGNKGIAGVAVVPVVFWATMTMAQSYPVAGLAPAERSAGAPVVTELTKDADWYARALTGVESPYPASLRFLEDQGAWHTPFLRPGMTGPYDIRRWHGED